MIVSIIAIFLICSIALWFIDKGYMMVYMLSVITSLMMFVILLEVGGLI